MNFYRDRGPFRILILDDQAERQDRYRQHYAALSKTGKGPYLLFEARSYRDFCRHMEQAPVPFDFISLDHDLGDFNPAYRPGDPDPLNPREFTGCHAAEYLINYAALFPGHQPHHVAIHSHNPIGSLQMMQILNRGGLFPAIAPFTPSALYAPAR